MARTSTVQSVRLVKTVKGGDDLVEVVSDPARIVALKFDGYQETPAKAEAPKPPKSSTQS